MQLPWNRMPTRFNAKHIMSIFVSLCFVMVLFYGLYRLDRRDFLKVVAHTRGIWVDEPLDYQRHNFAAPDQFGEIVRLSDFSQDLVFLNFWMTSCQPCAAEMPAMEALNRIFGEGTFKMIAVSLDPDKTEIARFVASRMPDAETTITMIHDPEAVISRSFGTELVPETYLIKDGRILVKFVNMQDWTSPPMLALIKRLLSS